MYEGPVQDLVDELARLPSIGPKSAQRLAFHLLNAERTDVERLADALRALEKVGFCTQCHNVAEGDLCRICANSKRDPGVLCVVEEPRDVIAVERTNEFDGLYHVLGGALSPLDGITPERLHVRELMERVSAVGPEGAPVVREIILCTNPTVDGEATASYLLRELQATGRGELSVSRIASGLPVGGDLEYADEVTLGRALSGRRTL
jgi:recombination protein RecR